jgi:hypothetical protein
MLDDLSITRIVLVPYILYCIQEHLWFVINVKNKIFMANNIIINLIAIVSYIRLAINI